MNAIKQMRAQRVKALAEGTAEPVAFWFDDPELLTVDDGGVFQIYFNDMIDDWFGISSAMITEALLTAGGKDVLVHVNSPGGMVFEGLSIHSAFKQYAGKVTMRVEGLAASAASFVILGGDEVLVEPGAMIMIHDAWDVTIGNAADHRRTADVLDKVSESVATMYAEKAGGSTDEWRAAMTKDNEGTWYSSAEAVDVGLADSVVATSGASDTASRKTKAARWSGVFAKAPRRPAAATVTEPPEGDPPPVVPDLDAPALPAEEPGPAPPAPDPAPVEPEPTEDLADLLAGIDLSAALRTAFPTRGVPA